MDYIDLDLTVDSTALKDDAEAWLQAGLPGWQPSSGNLETLLIEAMGRLATQIAVLAGRVPVAIFRYFGQSVLKVPSLIATAATGTTVWTLTDTLGHVIPAGTQISIAGVGFETVADAVVAAGSSTATIAVAATLPGAGGSGLSAPVALIDVLAFVDHVTVTGVTTGGTDGETDTGYVNRLADELPTLSPKAILLADFEALARANPAVSRALAIDNYVPGTNEQQTVTLTGATGGTFPLTYSGQTAAGIAYNAAASAVQTALAALSNIGAGNVMVSGPAGGPWLTEFIGALAGTDVAQMTTSAASLTGTAPTATVTTTRAGVAPLTAAEGAVTVAVHDAAGNALSSTVKAAITTVLAGGRVLNLLVSVIDPAFSTIDVAFTAHCYVGWDAPSVQAQAIATIQAFLDPTRWGQPALGQARRWVDEPVVRRNDLIGIVYSVGGVRHVDSLTLAIGGGVQGTADVTMPGPASLTRPGAVTGTVTT